jgi:dTDP-4-dehydrorhamnose reductase
MLGHRLYRYLRSTHDASVTLRQPLDAYAGQGLFDEANAYPAVDVRSVESIERAIADHRPQAVVNAVGIVKQRDDSNDVPPVRSKVDSCQHRLRVLRPPRPL